MRNAAHAFLYTARRIRLLPYAMVHENYGAKPGFRAAPDLPPARATPRVFLPIPRDTAPVWSRFCWRSAQSSAKSCAAAASGRNARFLPLLNARGALAFQAPDWYDETVSGGGINHDESVSKSNACNLYCLHGARFAADHLAGAGAADHLLRARRGGAALRRVPHRRLLRPPPAGRKRRAVRRGRSALRAWCWDCFLLFKANTVVAVLAAVIGVAVVIDSILRLQISLNLRRVTGGGWIALFVTAVVTLVFGILLLFNPFTAVKVATIVAGASLLADGSLHALGPAQDQERQAAAHRYTQVTFARAAADCRGAFFMSVSFSLTFQPISSILLIQPDSFFSANFQPVFSALFFQPDSFFSAIFQPVFSALFFSPTSSFSIDAKQKTRFKRPGGEFRARLDQPCQGSSLTKPGTS